MQNTTHSPIVEPETQISTFRSQPAKFPTEDPNYQLIRRVPSRFLNYHF
jgi:hypothetical protein